jgi:hypothetical protein
MRNASRAATSRARDALRTRRLHSSSRLARQAPRDELAITPLAAEWIAAALAVLHAALS